MIFRPMLALMVVRDVLKLFFNAHVMVLFP